MTDTTTTTSTAPNAWSRWGAQDERGSLNFIGPNEVRRATALVRTGEVLRLAQLLSSKTPVPGHRCGLQHFMARDGGYQTALMSSFADVDNDGDLDLFLGSYSAKPSGVDMVDDPNELYLNDGTGRYGPTMHL